MDKKFYKIFQESLEALEYDLFQSHMFEAYEIERIIENIQEMLFEEYLLKLKENDLITYSEFEIFEL